MIQWNTKTMNKFSTMKHVTEQTVSKKIGWRKQIQNKDSKIKAREANYALIWQWRVTRLNGVNNWKIVTICYIFDQGQSVFWLRMKEIGQYLFCSDTSYKEASQREMTSIEILKTQEMARGCMNSNNKNCRWWKSKRSQKLLLLVVKKICL